MTTKTYTVSITIDITAKTEKDCDRVAEAIVADLSVGEFFNAYRDCSAVPECSIECYEAEADDGRVWE